MCFYAMVALAHLVISAHLTVGQNYRRFLAHAQKLHLVNSAGR